MGYLNYLHSNPVSRVGEVPARVGVFEFLVVCEREDGWEGLEMWDVWAGVNVGE